MSDSVRCHKRQPTRLPHPWGSPGKNTGVGCHFLLQCMKVKSEREVTQACPTLSNPMECSLPGSSVHGICQARVLEWVAIAFSVWAAYRQLLVTLKPTHLHSFTNPPSRPFSFPVTFTFSASDLSDLSAPTCHKHSPM